jgi:hypothetical protein
MHLRHEALTAVNLKITIFWDVTPYSLVDIMDVSEERAVHIRCSERRLIGH